jgi:peroxiredoxin
VQHFPLSTALLCVLGLLSSASAVHAAQTVEDFTLPSARDNSQVRLSDHAGKVVLIHWWRTSCRICQKETPKLVAFHKKHADKGLAILGVCDDTADSVAEVPAWLKRQDVTWPVGLNDQGEFMREIRPKGSGETPGYYVVSRSGQLTYLALDRKPEDWKKVEETVERLLAEPAPEKPAVPPRELQAAPDFSLSDLKGKKVGLKDFAGKPLVVNFFNADSCDWAGAVLSKLHEEYSPKGLQIVGIDLFDDDAAIQKCIEKHKVPYPVLRGDEAVQKAWIGEAKGWATFFVDSKGRIVKKIADSIDNGLEGTVFRKLAEHVLER